MSIDGTDEFKMRVESDLEALRATECGKKLLSELDKSGKTVTINQTNDQNGHTKAIEPNKAYVTPDGKRGDGTNSTISYNPAFRGTEDYVPIGVLFHEGIHAYNNVTGTKQSGEQARKGMKNVNRCEQQAVGLEIKGGIEVTHPDGTRSVNNPDQLTENAIREELGLQRRDVY